MSIEGTVVYFIIFIDMKHADFWNHHWVLIKVYYFSICSDFFVKIFFRFLYYNHEIDSYLLIFCNLVRFCSQEYTSLTK